MGIRHYFDGFYLLYLFSAEAVIAIYDDTAAFGQCEFAIGLFVHFAVTDVFHASYIDVLAYFCITQSYSYPATESCSEFVERAVSPGIEVVLMAYAVHFVCRIAAFVNLCLFLMRVGNAYGAEPACCIYVFRILITTCDNFSYRK